VNALRDAVRAVWERVLQTPVADDTDFFQLGGNSLHAISICSGLEESVSVRPRLRVIFDHPRFEDYARQIAALAAGGA
jgi:Phosphopantetheine attachment site